MNLNKIALYPCLFLSIVCLTVLFSCQDRLDSKRYEPIIKQATKAESVTLNAEKDTAILRLSYKTAPAISSDFLTSITAITYIDTAASIISKEKIGHVKVEIASPNGVEVFSYPLTDLNNGKIGFENTAKFLQNMLNNQGQANLGLVDTSKISTASLADLNTLNTQIQSSMKIENISYDGFISHDEEPEVIEIRAQLISKTETLPVVFQYNTQSQKIFYFGINE